MLLKLISTGGSIMGTTDVTGYHLVIGDTMFTNDYEWQVKIVEYGEVAGFIFTDNNNSATALGGEAAINDLDIKGRFFNVGDTVIFVPGSVAFEGCDNAPG